MADDGEEAISVYDEVEIEDMTFDLDLQIYHYPCPCGDRFEIALLDLRDGEEIAICPSCSLMIRVVFEVVSRLCSCFSGVGRSLLSPPGWDDKC
jgi:diphthamide biosynthesis protein 3